MELFTVRRELHQQMLTARSIEIIIGKTVFTRLWDISTETERKTVYGHSMERRRILLARWIRDHRALELEEQPVAKLKEIASQLSIRNWSRMTKLELLKAIKESTCEES